MGTPDVQGFALHRAKFRIERNGIPRDKHTHLEQRIPSTSNVRRTRGAYQTAPIGTANSDPDLVSALEVLDTLYRADQCFARISKPVSLAAAFISLDRRHFTLLRNLWSETSRNAWFTHHVSRCNTVSQRLARVPPPPVSQVQP